MNGTVVGIDIGATLAKLAIREPHGKVDCSFLPAAHLDQVVAQVDALAPRGVGLTGCGANALASRLSQRLQRLVEFQAWAHGSRELLRTQGRDEEAPYALVSLGTGTSVLLVDGQQVERLGGTALGGGTLLGLGFALTGCQTHQEFCALAQRGRRDQVDLLVGDIYPPDEIEIPGEATAAAFGRLARQTAQMRASDGQGADQSADLAAAVTHLVGENVALIATSLTQRSVAQRIVFGGASLGDNPGLRAVLMGVTAAMGFEPILLDDGGYAGAIGALRHAESEQTAEPAN